MARKKINSLELPDDVEYKLTKKTAVNPNSFFISEGQSVTGELRTNPIRVGERCAVFRTFSDCISTSLVKEIKIKKGSKVITLITENSVYQLEEV